MKTPAELIDRHLLTRYRPGGRGPVYFDCWGRVLDVCREMGWPVPVDPHLVAETVAARRTGFASHYRLGDWIKAAGPADGVIGVTPSIGRALHAGICAGGVFLETGRQTGPRWRPFDDVRGERWEWVRWAG